MPRLITVSLFVAALVIAACATLSPRQDEQRNQPDQNQRPPEEVASDAPAIPREDQKSGVPAPQAQEQADKMETGSLADWAMVCVSLLAIMVAAKTYRSVVEQSRATTDAANAAQRSADIAADALKITNRARLVVDTVEIDVTQLANTGRIDINPIVKNIGITPGKIIQANLTTAYGKAKDLPTPPVYDQSRSSGLNPLTIHHGTQRRKGNHITVRDAATKTALLNGSMEFLTWGFFDYRDALLRATDPPYRVCWAVSYNIVTGILTHISLDGYTDAD